MATSFVSRQYRDLDLNFNIHPLKKDINKNLDEIAVVNSIKNIVSTNFYEKPFSITLDSGRILILIFLNFK